MRERNVIINNILKTCVLLLLSILSMRADRKHNLSLSSLPNARKISIFGNVIYAETGSHVAILLRKSVNIFLNILFEFA